MHFNLHALALLAALCWSHFSYADQSTHCSSLLAAAQVEVLQATVNSTNHYTIKVLAKEIAGKTKAVVILGERAHTKGQQDSDLGKQILKQFSVFGIESASPAATWGGRAMAWPANWARKKGWLPQKAGRSFPAHAKPDGKLHVRVRAQQSHALGKLVYGSGQFASTIQEAYLVGRSRQELLLSDLRLVFEKYNIASLTNEAADQFIFQIGEREIPGSLLAQTILDLESSMGDYPLVVNLEQNHQPTLTENLGSVIIPTVLGACVVKLGFVICDSGKAAAHASELSSEQAMDAVSTALAVGAGLALATIGDRVLGKWDVPGLVLKYTRDLFLVNGRDVSMAKRVKDAFSEEPLLDSMLVIVGANHVDGLAKNLTSTYGFQERLLPQESLKNE